MGDEHRRVAAGHGALEQQRAGRRRGAVEQLRALALGGLAQRRLQQRAHHAEGEVALERARRGAAHEAAGVGGGQRGVLEQRRLAQARGRVEHDDPAVAVGQAADRAAEHLELDRALDERRVVWSRRGLRCDDVEMGHRAATRGTDHVRCDAQEPETFPARANTRRTWGRMRVAATKFRVRARLWGRGCVAVIAAMLLSAAGLLIEPVPAPSAYDALREALAAERCVILDGGTADGATRGPAEALALHRRYVRAGCDVVSTDTRGLIATPADGGRHPHWMELARRGVRLAREAIAKEGREGEVAVAFSIDADVDRADGAETIRLLGRALAQRAAGPPGGRGARGDRPDAATRRSRRCWPSGCPCGCHSAAAATGCAASTASTGAARRATRSGARRGASRSSASAPCCWAASRPTTSTGCSRYLRDFTDLPLGVHPNVGYPTSDGWHLDADAGHDEFARMAVRWREEGAQLIGGCCGVGPDQIRRRARGAGGQAAGRSAPRGRGVPTSSAAPTRRRPSRGSIPPGARCTRSPSPTSSARATCSCRRRARS